MDKIISTLNSYANPQKAKILQRFFKTGREEYGEGDRFLGIVVPLQRKIARQYQDLTLNDVLLLLKNPIHEYRLVALLILILQYNGGDEKTKDKVVRLYLKNTKFINNWDLVDLSAPQIVGEYLKDKDKSVLYKMAKTDDLWKKRIAMLSCFTFIKNHSYKDALTVATILLSDKHDLIHKAVGWMLREIGKRNQRVEEEFLKKYYHVMPRTMLRYAIERFEDKKRQLYMSSTIKRHH
ncbi:DNA alkylation repair protein [Candidatus Roizmanbacteria bacterium RIFOXYB2_FULL_38_10]|uniref:DNA alkylation repair protein n=1 Tax=Candidatus Roizmanbacteria bacterium RIFOXYD1_FULL_38_12 TaxID=1802093 RepID=A0A1F7L168_9BACT|nr:MAG: DNA alkylation repair protein [Candidatus Roizmanbacteria bacterium RIFOXYA2_FULL_38_14]OGK63823.1 MAG: DNA alkylation repair protein [Candidatus Roizmanbacteria bacterium RIFOXYA1_FULL_37_12]OGK65669.1 MAG: DNA alkylation repair protein [Candidatus Roizmanbacteria bacterium RIFOXYB1_FULL_40_23]OGK67443.1 MAG: DNA alkylation repair protein [Candidatus Roizmanbacteria bacterium RIFOXYB2_FULL_38_10]OGK70074.1 MAG: DNA alkylation repair protein [Candidatus Roizmanbacteria bacterium RIFOXYC